MKHWLLLCLCLQLVSGCKALLPSPIARFELQTPRPFGYVIGDEIRHRVIIETRQDVTLDPESLPKPGELNRWLNLNHVSIETGANPNQTVVDLRYQVFYAPNEVKMLSIPSFTLRFRHSGQVLEKTVPAWHFTLSPLKELVVRKDQSGLTYLRPDAQPTDLSSDGQWLTLYAGLSLSVCAGLYLAYLYGVFPLWPKQRIFKRALRELSDRSQQDITRGLAIVHHAFNLVNDQPLFSHRLPAFYRDHPEYRAAAAHIEQFFAYSDAVFFAAKRDVNADDWHRLRALCRLCRDIECGKR